MSPRIEESDAEAAVFAALGEPTRLRLVKALAPGQAMSIVQLGAALSAMRAGDSGLTRQAITKHLKVLEIAGIVKNTRSGRESLFSIAPTKLQEAQVFLSGVARQWDANLSRLESFLDEEPE